MKRTICILLTLAVSLVFFACNAPASDSSQIRQAETTIDPNEARYQEAAKFMSNKLYDQALDIYEELEQSDYKDSAEMVKEAKYQYVLVKKEQNTGGTVYEYLKSLTAAKYKDSEAIYEELYSWKFEIAFSETQRSMYHNDTVDATRQTFPFYYINFRITGGEPGEDLHGQYEILFSNGKISTAGYGDGNGTVLSLTVSATENPTGLTKFTLYDDYGNVLATKSAYIQ